MFYGTVANITSRITKQVACYALNTQNCLGLKEAKFWGKFPGNMHIYTRVFKNIHIHTMSLLSTVSRNLMQWK